MKKKAWDKGISPNEFRKTLIKDLMDIWELEQAFLEKTGREQKIRDLQAQMQTRFR